MSQEDLNTLEFRRFQVADISRFYSVPLHLLNETDKSTSWGSGLSEQTLAFLIYTIDPDLGRIEAELNYKLFFCTDMYLEFDRDTESGNALPIPTDNDASNAGAILSENTQTGNQDVTFGAVTLNSYTYSSKLVLLSNQLLLDSAFNLDAFLSGKLGTRIARAVNTHTTAGDGSSKPTGAVTAARLGATGASGKTASLIFDDLIELEHSVDPAYRKGDRFMFADSTLKAIKKLKDSQNRYIWQPGLTMNKEPDTINGYQFTVNQDMPVMATSAKSILFGDFSKYWTAAWWACRFCAWSSAMPTTTRRVSSPSYVGTAT